LRLGEFKNLGGDFLISVRSAAAPGAGGASDKDSTHYNNDSQSTNFLKDGKSFLTRDVVRLLDLFLVVLERLITLLIDGHVYSYRSDWHRIFFEIGDRFSRAKEFVVRVDQSSALIPSSGTGSSPLLAILTVFCGLSPAPLGTFSILSTMS